MDIQQLDNTAVSWEQQIFSYKGINVRTKQRDGNVFICLTDFAKMYPRKNLATILHSMEMQEYINKLESHVNSEIKNFISTENQAVTPSLVVVIKGGNANEQGTWAYSKVALRVAQKLDTDFALWVDDRIEELARYGITATKPTIEKIISDPDYGIQLLTSLKEEREKNALLQQQYKEEQSRRQILEEQKGQLEVYCNKAKPKVEYFDQFMGTNRLTSIRNSALEMCIPETVLIGLLLQHGFLYRDQRRKLRPYATYVPRLFETKDYVGANGRSDSWTLITPYGKKYFYDKWYKEYGKKNENDGFK